MLLDGGTYTHTLCLSLSLIRIHMESPLSVFCLCALCTNCLITNCLFVSQIIRNQPNKSYHIDDLHSI